MDQARHWIRNVVTNLANHPDSSVAVEVLEACGRRCASGWAALQADECRATVGPEASEAELVDALAGRLHTVRRDGQNAYFEYGECYCDLAKSTPEMPPAYCNCSMGWVREVMEHLLGRPVSVTLERSVLRGDTSCLFMVPLTA